MGSAITRQIENISRQAEISDVEIAEFLGTSPETVSRWISAKIQPKREAIQRLLELESFVSELAEFYPPKDAHKWLLSPHRLLGGSSPAEKIREGRADEGFALLDQLRSGAYV